MEVYMYVQYMICDKNLHKEISRNYIIFLWRNLRLLTFHTMYFSSFHISVLSQPSLCVRPHNL